MEGKALPPDEAILPYLDDILNVFGDGIALSDRNGYLIKINDMYEQLAGFSREEILGKTVDELQANNCYSVVLNPQIVRTRKPATVAQTTRRGQQLVVSGVPILDRRGEVAFVIVFVRDVTSMEALKEQLSEQQAVIEQYHRQLGGGESPATPLPVQSGTGRVLEGFFNKISRSEATVFLHGETGVGKNVAASAIHRNSPRNGGPFIKVDCGAIPEHLIESELFGYSPGAFSGALSKGKPGMLELADKGTLFLDEIAELPLIMQSKLLRFLQDRELVRLGSTAVRKVDARIIAATNRDLEAEVEAGRFRKDLYYRLCVVECRIPPCANAGRTSSPSRGIFCASGRPTTGKTLPWAGTPVRRSRPTTGRGTCASLSTSWSHWSSRAKARRWPCPISPPASCAGRRSVPTRRRTLRAHKRRGSRADSSGTHGQTARERQRPTPAGRAGFPPESVPSRPSSPRPNGPCSGRRSIRAFPPKKSVKPTRSAALPCSGN